MNNNKKQTIQIPGIVIFLAFLLFPPVGIFLAILKYSLKPRMKQRQHPIHMNKDGNQAPNENYYGDHEEVKREPKVENFDHTITVRCPQCNSSNFTDHLPSKCEYCGQTITKKS